MNVEVLSYDQISVSFVETPPSVIYLDRLVCMCRPISNSAGVLPVVVCGMVLN